MYTTTTRYDTGGVRVQFNERDVIGRVSKPPGEKKKITVQLKLLGLRSDFLLSFCIF